MKLWMAPHGLHIELGITADARTLAKLHAAEFFRGWPEGEIRAFLADAATPVFVACDAKRRVMGFAIFRMAADEAELLTIIIVPKWRGKGVGAALLRAGFDDFLLSPVTRVFLEVDEANKAAIDLYTGFGFSTVGSRKGYYPRPDGSAATALTMRCELG